MFKPHLKSIYLHSATPAHAPAPGKYKSYHKRETILINYSETFLEAEKERKLNQHRLI